MEYFRIISGAILIVFLVQSPVLAQTLEELQQEHALLTQAVNDPDLIWIPKSFLWPEKFMTRQQLEERVMTILISKKIYSHEKYFKTILTAVELSKETKKLVLLQTIPELEADIRVLTQQQNDHLDPDGGSQQSQNADNAIASSSSFANTLNEITSSDHLEQLSLDNILNNTSVNNDASDLGDCAMKNPEGDKRGNIRFYPNREDARGTYLLCKYDNTGHLSSEQRFLNNVKVGLQTNYRYDSIFSTHYPTRRTQYADGKMNGLDEAYRISKSGAVYRAYQTAYADGQKHGDSVQYYESGRERSSTSYFMGAPQKKYQYRKDGSLSLCTKYDPDGRPVDCRTGRTH